MEILHTHWFANSTGCVGLIIAKDEMGKINGYIGNADGLNEASDQAHILAWGTKIEEPNIAEHYIKSLKLINEKENI